MKYVAMIYGSKAKWDAFPHDEWVEAVAAQDAFNTKYRATGELVAAYGLGDETQARLVRREDGAPVVSDGPYLETKEYIGSFYLLDVDSAERAQEIVADMPWAAREPVELWPVLHSADDDL
ncbi:YciI family protein [Actinomadura rupiterrae]|uniref:YciI family protein n=1 Tax=Actinomadura rupiterrae TaxID=559627 RepID=UPI0020A5E5F9|nr:YciI family protein [Actinomadura rupiterrae]MCP2340213.1 hypothetical protein [Actinomadura rupiterrae]